ncbi:MAG: hypothetical protein KGS45_11160 [Planctomycetes bacterium]|nr:hypothetical protein [Planctomycetota bacterium]
MNASANTSSGDAPAATSGGSSKFLFDISGIDLSKRLVSREEIGKVNPHRGDMALLDYIAWQSPDLTKCIGVVKIKGNEFWVQGHFPGKPMFPGVLMVEAGAQLANYIFNVRTPITKICALLGVDDARFRAPVEVGQDLIVLLDSVKWTATRFTSRVQGVVNGQIAFEVTVMGIAIAAEKQV